jgi:hypothetical protein
MGEVWIGKIVFYSSIYSEKLKLNDDSERLETQIFGEKELFEIIESNSSFN